jgi:hypothetical protein
MHTLTLKSPALSCGSLDRMRMQALIIINACMRKDIALLTQKDCQPRSLGLMRKVEKWQ